MASCVIDPALEVMVRHSSLVRTIRVLWLLGIVGTGAAPASAPLTVMTFNIRYGTAEDGENRWDQRRDLLFEVIRTENADVVGLQEALRFQIDEIIAAVPAYAFVGVGRDDGRDAGEYSAILYRRSRLSVIDSGTFWFSDTPEQPGSTSWGNRITRICTWARFRDRSGGAFSVYNLHLDHESQPSRERSVQLLAQRIRNRAAQDEPVIVTGDFNADEQNPAMRWLLGDETAIGGAAPRGIDLADTFRALHSDARGVGTFTGFTFDQIDERKIDYVLTNPGFAAREARIVHTSRNRKYPSDHFPVVAIVGRKSGAARVVITGNSGDYDGPEIRSVSPEFRRFTGRSRRTTAPGFTGRAGGLGRRVQVHHRELRRSKVSLESSREVSSYRHQALQYSGNDTRGIPTVTILYVGCGRWISL